jgi:hypothetical protein
LTAAELNGDLEIFGEILGVSIIRLNGDLKILGDVLGESLGERIISGDFLFVLMCLSCKTLQE